MPQQNNVYKRIIKSTSVFGAVQLINILISIIKSKFLAVLIGPAGYGIFSLYNTTADLLRIATGFGIETSGVKKIAESKSSNDEDAIAHNSAIIIRLAVITGLLGVIIAVAFSKYISIWTFGNSSSTTAIILISFSILMKQVFSSQSAVMQGLDQFKYLAKTNLYGNLSGLFITLPLFYFYGINAIAASIVISSLINVIISSVYYRKLKIKKVQVTSINAVKGGREILFFGGLLSISSFLPLLANYLIQLFIANTSSYSEVGLYNVTMTVINSYIGIIFTVMGTEYYPRLATTEKDPEKESEAISNQAIFSLLIILPIITFVLGFSPYLIKLLFSEKFIDIIPILSWAIVAMYFKSVSFCFGYLIIARGDSKLFIKTAIVFNALYLLLCTAGFYYRGLEGLGIGLTIYFILHLISIYFITKVKYGITLSAEFIRLFSLGSVFCVVLLMANRLHSGGIKEIVFLGFFIISLSFFIYEINKRVNIRQLVNDYINKVKK